MMPQLRWAWLIAAAMVAAGALLRMPPLVAFGAGLAASLSLAGSI
jgi:hypothetical protein